MKSLVGLDEELYRLPILHTLVEVFEQWLLLVVYTLCYLGFQFLDIGMLRIVWLDGQTLEHVA